MTRDDRPAPGDLTPASFLAAAAALDTIHEALHTARTTSKGAPPDRTSSEQALAALLLLREAREQLAEWEPGLIETAREAGASWAELAHPLGVSSRQAAERRYLRVRPGHPGSTGEERVQATRDRRAADRTVTTWARANGAALRQLAGQITALTDLPTTAGPPLADLTAALADNDPAALLTPLTDTHPYLAPGHPDLAARVDDLTRHTDRLRQDSDDHRGNGTRA
ncbi:type III effector protein [Streptomyces sp. S.PB5]|uniref:type III effector protein n=1 Tax=Streptomyces sp. S.PB5 TaxID=3020844 RepID=UPI0025B26CB6|nr:type III effector protein [Streptomyces sp. S.PB5]MDN3023407.1 type III effector protein [Streptomyces sp. S.PB5]